MIRGGFQLDVSDRDAECIPNGLHANYPCMTFNSKDLPRCGTWYLRDKDNNRGFKFTDLPPSSDELVTDKSTCYAVIFRSLPPQVIDIGVVVMIDPKAGFDEEDGLPREVCAYVRKVTVTRIPLKFLDRTQPEHCMDMLKLGQARLRIT